MQEGNSNKKKILTGTLVAVIFLIVVVISATYAYFSLSMGSDTTETNANAKTGSLNNITLVDLNKKLHIKVDASDMSEDNKGTNYYATDDEEKNYLTKNDDYTINIANITIEGDITSENSCTAELVVNVPEETTTVLHESDTLLHVDIKGENPLEEDLVKIVKEPYILEFTINNNETIPINAWLRLSNRDDDQTYLAGNKLDISLAVQNLKCGGSKEALAYIAKTSVSGTLETKKELAKRNEEIENYFASEKRADVVGAEIQIEPDTLRRFIGTTAEVTDNFICFGTSDTNTCKNNLDQYMYRIIGIDTTSKQVKVIKATKVVKGLTYMFYWNYSRSSDIKWGESHIYLGINKQPVDNYTEKLCTECFIGNKYYSYMEDESWKNLIIANPTWYDSDSPLSTYDTGATTFTKERLSKLENGYSIGLMYVSDYLYAGAQDTTNWLFIQNGLNEAINSGTPLEGELQQPNAESEWTMTRHGKNSSYAARTIHYNGMVDDVTFDTSLAVRPVFYLDGNKVMLDGKGTIGEPYYITNVN